MLYYLDTVIVIYAVEGIPADQQRALNHLAALEQAGGSSNDAVMVGDTPWDVRAARKAGVETIAVRTGGFGVDELRESGAVAVFESVAELGDGLDRTPLG